MQFSNQYNIFIQEFKPASKATLKPKNVYKIVSYDYVDGTSKRFTGVSTSYVFLIGIYDSKLSCVKISEFTPAKFFNWLTGLFQKTLTEEKINESQQLSDIIARSDKGGSRLFTNLKSSPLYDIKPTPYRTYNLSGIKQIQEIVFKKSKLLELSGIKVSNPTTEEITTNNP
jgi:hypothetical protein